jgi:proteasome lid subunit RPN8/RPN11
VILTPDELQEIRRHAEADYPSECCGVILVRGGEKRLLVRLRNAQDALHRSDPVRHPRDSSTAYAVDGQEWWRLVCRREDEGYRVAVIYHSHIDVGAYFSATDAQNALLGGDQPGYPDATWVVVSVVKGRAGDAAAFRWDAAERRFLSVDAPVLRA